MIRDTYWALPHHLALENKKTMHSPQSINVVESYLNKCLNVKDGRCNLTWKHEDCKVLMDILYEMTEDNKYKEEEWLFDPGKKLLWE
jgi:hypothetical protein